VLHSNYRLKIGYEEKYQLLLFAIGTFSGTKKDFQKIFQITVEISLMLALGWVCLEQISSFVAFEQEITVVCNF